MKSKEQDVVKTHLEFLTPSSNEWLPLKASNNKQAEKNKLHDMLLSSLQMPNVIVLAGSGTSLGEAHGPSMWDLWNYAINSNPEIDNNPDAGKKTEIAEKVINLVNYNEKESGQNIELLLSRCEAYLEFSSSKDVANFITDCKKIIIEKCSNFISDKNLISHQTFLHRLSKRRVSDSRLKIFTTNYDLCFETAAASLGLIVLDGFSFNQPRRFDPRFFGYDIVRRSQLNEEQDNYLEGVFHLLKIHGSVNWIHGMDGIIQEKLNPNPDEACLIYPASAKYKQSYQEPHLEIITQFLKGLRTPNTCLMIVGFGFNDDHLSEPIISAIKSNPSMRVIVVSPTAKTDVKDKKYWKLLYKRASQGDDVWLINASFQDFANLIPDLKSLTPAQQLEKAIKRMGETV